MGRREAIGSCRPELVPSLESTLAKLLFLLKKSNRTTRVHVLDRGMLEARFWLEKDLNEQDEMS